MKKFSYQATDVNGKTIRGQEMAEDYQDLQQKLKERNLYITRYRDLGANDAVDVKYKFKTKEVSFISRQLASMTSAGLSLVRALYILQEQQTKPKAKRVLLDIYEEVQKGKSFSEVLESKPGVFPDLFVSMVAAGESSGTLDQILVRVSDHFANSNKTNNKIKSAMVYPIVIMGVAVAIVAILMIFVVPQFQKIFTDMLKGNARMPALTQMIIDISDFMKENYILTGLIIVGVILFVKIFFKTKIGIRVWDTAALKLPKIGDLVMKSTVARFTRTFGTLLASGVPILEALTITRGTIKNSLISDALSRVHDRVRDGENLSTPLDQQNIFPTMVTSMVEVGEETGQLPEMLNRIADNYDDEVDNSVGAITSIIEPIMIVFLAVVVGTIVIALFLPIIQIIQNLTGG